MAGPGSHQLTNTRMPNHDTSVVIQQAMPSPQSSSVITQAPSTNRQIGWVHFHFLISLALWLLPVGPDVVLIVLKVQLHADVVLVVFEVTEFALDPARMSKDPCSTWGMARLLQIWCSGSKRTECCTYWKVLLSASRFFKKSFSDHSVCFFYNCSGKTDKVIVSWSFNFLQWEFWVFYGIEVFLLSSV